MSKVKTSCAREECPKRESECTFIIHNRTNDPSTHEQCPDGMRYMSRKTSIYRNYVRKCNEQGRKKDDILSHNEYFEC